MNSRLLSSSIIFFSFVLLVLAGVLYTGYVKVSEYVCYYGVNEFAGMRTSYSGTLDEGTVFSNGTYSNKYNVKCINSTRDNFVCPFGNGNNAFLGYDYIETDTLMVYLHNVT